MTEPAPAPTVPTAATWLGHATTLLEVGSARFVTDPVLVQHFAHLVRQAPAPPVPADLDAILLSHAHGDHLNRKTLRMIDPSVPIVVPKGIDPVVFKLGREVIELDDDDVITIGGTPIRAVPVDHDPKRAPWSRNPGAATGFVIGEELPIWFPGDTDLHPRLDELTGRVSLALLPVWGWGPSLGPGHLDPARAAEAAAIVDARIAVPIHWGTYFPRGLSRTHHHLLEEPAKVFVERVAQQSPQTRVEKLRVGGRVVLGPGDLPAHGAS